MVALLFLLVHGGTGGLEKNKQYFVRPKTLPFFTKMLYFLSVVCTKNVFYHPVKD